MGCGTSQRRCTVQQQAELFEIAAKEMLRLCIERSVASTDSLNNISIALPPEVAKVHQLSARLREVSATAKTHLAIGAGGVGAAAAASRASAEGGFFADFGAEEKSFFGHAAAFVDRAAEVIGASVGMAAEKALVIAADDLDQNVKDLEEQFSYAGRCLVWSSNEDVAKMYVARIDKVKLQNPVQLVRGAAPHGPAQYKACPSNALSAEFARMNAGELFETLLPLATKTLAEHKATEYWNTLMWKYDQANAKLREYVSTDSFKQAHGESDLEKALGEGPIVFDLNKYVVEQTIQQLAVLMGGQEAVLRLAPEGESTKPATFHLCFSKDLDGNLTLGKPLPLECYDCRDS